MATSARAATMSSVFIVAPSSKLLEINRATIGVVELTIDEAPNHTKIVLTSMMVKILRPFLLRFAIIFSAFPNNFSVSTLFSLLIHVSSSSIATSNYSRSLASFLLFLASFESSQRFSLVADAKTQDSHIVTHMAIAFSALMLASSFASYLP